MQQSKRYYLQLNRWWNWNLEKWKWLNTSHHECPRQPRLQLTSVS